MPYTPPSQQSPAASASPSPSVSRSHSYSTTPLASPPPRPDIPRSQSYLSRHRRTPSISKSDEVAGPTESPRATGAGHREVDDAQSQAAPKGGRRSPEMRAAPPRTGPNAFAGALDSPHNSSDDEDGAHKDSGRELENMAELQAAIQIIEQHRDGSPTRTPSESRSTRAALGIEIPSLSARQSGAQSNGVGTPPLSGAARRISHSRSSTESAIVSPNMGQAVSSESSDSESEELLHRPSMIRKKSGELVKPALRPSSVPRRPSSMPGTPTYSKAVHFDNDLEHVRHFLQVDRPLAVSAGSSPVESYEGDPEFPFGFDDTYQLRQAPFDWELVLSNFPPETEGRSELPVRVERVFLSTDKKTLLGSVAVANLAFNKSVVARFTLDYWKTTSEVVAEYNNDVRRKQTHDGCDRFLFSIKLVDQGDLERKTLFFCVRYTVNGQEFWDNNGAMNFQVDFRKKARAQNGKSGMQGAATRPLNSLPRSRPSPPASAGRPRSMPNSFDDFSDAFDTSYDFTLKPQPFMGESPPSAVRLKKVMSHPAPFPDTPARRSHAAGQAFGNRYDFGASLSAAMQSPGARQGSKRGGGAAGPVASPSGGKGRMAPGHARATNTSQARHRTDEGGSTGYAAEKPPLQSSSYHELLDKYCFFGSSKTSTPPGSGKTSPPGQADVPPPEPSRSVPYVESHHAAAAPTTTTSSEPVTSVPAPGPPTSSKLEVAESRRSVSPVSITSPHPSTNLDSTPAFGFPFHGGPHGGFTLNEPHTPTAIHG
ncbi:MAG: hypothetical protein M1838_005507 [Thelocarpon superellum]|nr:MAG: hypothetical protein M1838_005507 [Thelocarpon superellum]